MYLFWYMNCHGKASKKLVNTLTVEHGNVSNYEHACMLKMNNSYVKICESSHCLLVAFLLPACCVCLNCYPRHSKMLSVPRKEIRVGTEKTLNLKLQTWATCSSYLGQVCVRIRVKVNLSRTQKNPNRNLLYQEMSIRSGSNLFLRIPADLLTW
jgi:hypothetical protein